MKLYGWDLTDPDSLDSVNEFGVKTFMPSIGKEEREWKFAGWNRAVNRSMAWKSEFLFDAVESSAQADLKSLAANSGHG